MHRTRLILGGTIGAVMVLAAPLSAQLCVGVPLPSGQAVGSLSLGFPDNANTFGLSGHHALDDRLVLSGGYHLTTFDGAFDIPSMHTLGIGGAVRLQPMQAGFTMPVEACPTLALQYSTWDDWNILTLPLGVSLGTTFSIAADRAVAVPHVRPMLVWSRASSEGFSDSDTDFGLTAGANVILQNLLFGAEFSKIGEADGVFSVQVGLFFK